MKGRSPKGESPSQLIDARIEELGDWRGEGNTRRAIDFHEGDEVNEKALIALVRAAVAANALACV